MRASRVWSWGVVALVLLAGMPAPGATLSQTNSFSGVPNLTSYLLFNQFNEPAWGTVNSIYITLTLYASGGSLGADNDSTSTASGTVGFGAEATLSSEDVFLYNSSFQNTIGKVVASTSNSLTLRADDGDVEVGGTSHYSAQGVDYGQVLGQSVTKSASGYVASTFWSMGTGFIGTGSYTIMINANQYLNLGSLGGAQQLIDPLSVSGTVVVTYDYTGDGPPPEGIPEPSTIWLLVTGSLWIAWKAFRSRR